MQQPQQPQQQQVISLDSSDDEQAGDNEFNFFKPLDRSNPTLGEPGLACSTGLLHWTPQAHAKQGWQCVW
jgi:hypothetical protein